MNINDVKQLKEYYQTELQSRIAALLNLSTEAIAVNWTLENTIITIYANQQNYITKFTFEYDGTEFMIHTVSYQIITQNNVITGVAAGSATISLNTIHAIFDVVIEVLNSATNEDTQDADDVQDSVENEEK